MAARKKHAVWVSNFKGRGVVTVDLIVIKDGWVGNRQLGDMCMCTVTILLLRHEVEIDPWKLLSSLEGRDPFLLVWLLIIGLLSQVWHQVVLRAKVMERWCGKGTCSIEMCIIHLWGICWVGLVEYQRWRCIPSFGSICCCVGIGALWLTKQKLPHVSGVTGGVRTSLCYLTVNASG